MKLSKKHIMVSLAIVSAAILGSAIAISPKISLLGKFANAEAETYKMTIDKNSPRDATNSKVTARTDRGNSSVFSYNRFDTRPGTTDYNNCICFYKMQDGLGGWIKNDEPLYGIKNIKIFAYTVADPYPANTLTTSSFNVYYGYESILVNHSNEACVTIRNGEYTFENGFEPSYIALESLASFDNCISRIEISFLCEPVEGEIKTKSGPAYKYDYVGKEFTTQSGEKVPYNITESSPWVKLNGLDNPNNFKSSYSRSSYDAATQEWVTTGDDYLLFSSPELVQEAIVANRRILSATITLTVESGAGWNGATDLYFGVNATIGGSKMSRLYSAKILEGSQTWENNLDIISIIETDTNKDMTGKPINNVKVTIDYDISKFSGEIKNVGFGTSNAKIHVILHKIEFKATACGHSAYVVQNSTKAYQYDAVGTCEVCPICGDMPKTRIAITEKAPWLRLNGYIKEGSTLTMSPDGIYTSSTSGWQNKVSYNLPADLQGRTELAVTFTAPVTWNLYFYVSNNPEHSSLNQIVTDSTKINWSANPLITEVLGPDGASLGYNPTTFSVPTKVGINKTTLIYDLTKSGVPYSGNTLDFCFYDVGQYTLSVDLRTPCDHSSTEEFSNGIQYGTKCTKCGRLVTTFVSKLDLVCPAAHPGIMSYETGVTFDGRENCLKTTTTEYTNNEEMGWAVNYKLYFRNLVKNAREAGKPIIKLNVYLEAPTIYNIRLGWGVGNNASGAQADHYNPPNTGFVGSTIVKDNSTLTLEDGTPTTTALYYLPANSWRVLVLDVSGDEFNGIADFWISSNFDSNIEKTHYPISTYVSNIKCEAKA